MHEEVKVGGELNESRLRAIMTRGFALRNMAVLGKDVFTYKASTDPAEPPSWSAMGLPNHLDGETPALVKHTSGETSFDRIELHVGCGDLCGVLAEVPYDPDSKGCDVFVAEAIAHAGRDLIDLVREVRRLRSFVAVVNAIGRLSEARPRPTPPPIHLEMRPEAEIENIPTLTAPPIDPVDFEERKAALALQLRWTALEDALKAEQEKTKDLEKQVADLMRLESYRGVEDRARRAGLVQNSMGWSFPGCPWMIVWIHAKLGWVYTTTEESAGPTPCLHYADALLRATEWIEARAREPEKVRTGEPAQEQEEFDLRAIIASPDAPALLSDDRTQRRAVDEIDAMKADLDFLLWYFATADFGPADDDVRNGLIERYRREEGPVPPGFCSEEE